MSLRARLLFPLAAAAFACATTPSEPRSCPQLAEEGAAPARLRERAEAAIDARELESAYRCLALIETTHPNSSDSNEAFPLATALFKRVYHAKRFTEPNSPWVTTEPDFLFHWFAQSFGAEFPQEQANALFVGMPYSFYQQFQSFARTLPDPQRWSLRVEDDNGIIRSITATPAGS